MDESADLKIVAAVCLCVDERERGQVHGAPW